MDNEVNKTNKKPWVSFCMTTFKRPDFLREQITELLKQEFQDFVIIISDNDVEASARKVVEEFNDPRISYHCNGANLGMVKSFNASLRRAESEYVVMITDDDPVYPDMLSTVYKLTKDYPGYGMYMGGCNIMCLTPEMAKSMRAKVGMNSCLVDLPVNTIRPFSGKEFPFAYFKGETGHMLWSTGIVKREIALKIDGMPDFGAPYNTDFGYIVLAGAHGGAVLLNRALGHQVVHGTNYGYTESQYERFLITPDAFYNWVMDRLPKEHDYSGLKELIESFLGRWVVGYALSIKKYMQDKKVSDPHFENVVKKIFRIPYLRKWKWKYKIAVLAPNLFEILIDIKMRIFSKK